MERFSVPSAPTAFDHYQAELVSRCANSATSWNLPPETITELQAYQRRWEPAYAASVNPNTACPANTAARQDVFNSYRAAIIDVINHYLVNSPLVGVADKQVLGIHTGGGFHARRKSGPTSWPLLQVIQSAFDVHQLFYYDSEHLNSQRKPNGVGYCEIHYGIGEQPAAPEAAAFQLNVTRSGELIRFNAEDRGKTVFYFARWVTAKGHYGPWAPVVSLEVR